MSVFTTETMKVEDSQIHPTGLICLFVLFKIPDQVRSLSAGSLPYSVIID
jgi:hypothetical protein